MDKRRGDLLRTIIWLILLALALGGCITGAPTQREVTTEYLLTSAGFQRLEVNMETPKRQALLDNLPPGKISTYLRNGEVYHAYPGQDGKSLFIGNEGAYQNYLALSRGRQVCERVSGANQVAFWGCMEEQQQGGARGGGK